MKIFATSVCAFAVAVLSFFRPSAAAAYQENPYGKLKRRHARVSLPGESSRNSAQEAVAIVGTGNMGSAIAEVFCKNGIRIFLTSRSLAKADAKAKSIRSRFRQCSIVGVPTTEAIEKANFLILTTPFQSTASWLQQNQAILESKDDNVIIDISNPWRSGEGISADALLLSGVEVHIKALDDRKTHFVAAFKNNFAMKKLQHASGRNIVEFAVDSDAVKQRFEKLIRATGFTPLFRGKISEGAAAQLEAEVSIFCELPV